MTDALWTAILIAIPTTLTVLMPFIMLRVNNRQKNDDRDANWKRQDRIAKELEEKVNATASDAAAARNVISNKLDQVHTLVNGNITDFMQREADGLRREIAALEEVRDLKAGLQLDPNPVEETRLTLARARLGEVLIGLAAKMKADEMAKVIK